MQTEDVNPSTADASDPQPPSGNGAKRLPDLGGVTRELCMTGAGDPQDTQARGEAALTEAGFFVQATASTTKYLLGGVLKPHDVISAIGVGPEARPGRLPHQAGHARHQRRRALHGRGARNQRAGKLIHGRRPSPRRDLAPLRQVPRPGGGQPGPDRAGAPAGRGPRVDGPAAGLGDAQRPLCRPERRPVRHAAGRRRASGSSSRAATSTCRSGAAASGPTAGSRPTVPAPTSSSGSPTASRSGSTTARARSSSRPPARRSR